jgi:CheY-like chemotaxis protein
MTLLNSPVVLLVDDEPIIRMAASDILTNIGAVVLEAGNADEAFRILKLHNNIRLVFSDVNMPGTMNGLTLLERVHELRPAVELILTSGRGEYAFSKLPDSGTFLSKPYNAFKLGDLVTDKLAGVTVEPAGEL